MVFQLVKMLLNRERWARPFESKVQLLLLSFLLCCGGWERSLQYRSIKRSW